jgi:mycofactocin precursor
VTLGAVRLRLYRVALSANTPEVHVNEPTLAQPAEREDAAEETLADDELLVEEVSIDGMCGVY